MGNPEEKYLEELKLEAQKVLGITEAQILKSQENFSKLVAVVKENIKGSQEEAEAKVKEFIKANQDSIMKVKGWGNDFKEQMTNFFSEMEVTDSDWEEMKKSTHQAVDYIQKKTNVSVEQAKKEWNKFIEDIKF